MEDVAQDLLDGYEGTFARLQLERTGEQRIRVEFRRSKLLSSTIIASSGLALKAAPGEALVVESIARGSIADRSGLLPNDVILQINDFDFIKIADELNKKPEEQTKITDKQLTESLFENLSKETTYLKILRRSTNEILEFMLSPKSYDRPIINKRTSKKTSRRLTRKRT
jgi:hypothetical protein